MNEKNKPKSLEERIALCPIHKWINVKQYLIQKQVPSKYWIAFHELVLARGKFSKRITNEEAKSFGKEAVAIVLRHNFSAMEAQPLKMIFSHLIDLWINANLTQN